MRKPFRCSVLLLLNGRGAGGFSSPSAPLTLLKNSAARQQARRKKRTPGFGLREAGLPFFTEPAEKRNLRSAQPQRNPHASDRRKHSRSGQR